jgi:hypothetical protein
MATNTLLEENLARCTLKTFGHIDLLILCLRSLSWGKLVDVHIDFCTKISSVCLIPKKILNFLANEKKINYNTL